MMLSNGETHQGVSGASNMYEQDEILTIREVAKYLKMNERSIYKLAHQGLIPTVKIASQWRFRKNLIDAWLESQMSSSAIASVLDDASDNMPVFSLLKPEGITTNLAGRRKDEVLEELANLMVQAHFIKDRDLFLREIFNREKLCTTAIQRGVAMPHPRRNGNQFAGKPAVVFGCSKEGVDFGSLDGEPTHLFFMLCAPQDRLHLKIMAKINRLLGNPDVREGLIAATSAEEVIDIIKREEGVKEIQEVKVSS
jgi:PTS system nitrogen regulatory IIA component